MVNNEKVTYRNVLELAQKRGALDIYSLGTIKVWFNKVCLPKASYVVKTEANRYEIVYEVSSANWKKFKEFLELKVKGT